MKRLNPKTQRKLYWLFTPMILVGAIIITYLWFDINLLNHWFNIDVDILEWGKPALVVSLLVIFVGQSIAAIKQKCWGELFIALTILIIVLINANNIFVPIPN